MSNLHLANGNVFPYQFSIPLDLDLLEKQSASLTHPEPMIYKQSPLSAHLIGWISPPLLHELPTTYLRKGEPKGSRLLMQAMRLKAVCLAAYASHLCVVFTG